MNTHGLFLSLVVLCVNLGSSWTSPPLEGEGNCGDVSTDECLEKLQIFLRLNSLPFTSDPKQLDNLCNTAIQGYNCSTWLYQNKQCLSPKDSEMLPGFIHMAEYTCFMLCGDGYKEKGYLRDAFLQHSACVLEHRAALDCCARETSLPDLPVLRAMQDSSKSTIDRQHATCCPLTRYLKCLSTTTEEYCGADAANFTVEYARRAAGEPVQALCQSMPGYPEPDVCPGPVPECSSCQTVQAWSLMMMVVASGVLVRKWW